MEGTSTTLARSAPDGETKVRRESPVPNFETDERMAVRVTALFAVLATLDNMVGNKRGNITESQPEASYYQILKGLLTHFRRSLTVDSSEVTGPE